MPQEEANGRVRLLEETTEIIQGDKISQQKVDSQVNCLEELVKEEENYV